MEIAVLLGTYNETEVPVFSVCQHVHFHGYFFKEVKLPTELPAMTEMFYVCTVQHHDSH